MSDMYTAYPMALQFIQKELGIEINHTSVKGLEEVKGEDAQTRIAKQKIERLNRVFKESYRITTGYFNIQGARYSFELWMFYYNYMRREKGKFKNTLNFIDKNVKVDNLLIPDKWSYVFEYIKFKLSN
ncbi:integrase core domain-containing protein [Oceanivirga salmonicida]|uniref:DDE-type integrase/transposase/recombinase n=1 Tax=Oceanivirga salmonicida TaxID=1769291 RepID=UPI0012E21217|nr:DDE-type integrase/transposase/recombinase [Oceanivirga salmonicida]